MVGERGLGSPFPWNGESIRVEIGVFFFASDGREDDLNDSISSFVSSSTGLEQVWYLLSGGVIVVIQGTHSSISCHDLSQIGVGCLEGIWILSPRLCGVIEVVMQ